MRSLPFFRYFFTYILHAKTRQRLLFIAVIGLFISAFSLMVIQGIMGGLQEGLVARSKAIHGHDLIQFENITSEDLSELKQILKKSNLPSNTSARTTTRALFMMCPASLITS